MRFTGVAAERVHGKPREVVALERRIDGHDDVVVFHVFEPVQVLTLTTTIGGAG